MTSLKSFTLSASASNKAREWAAFQCPRCGAAKEAPCVALGDPAAPRPAWCVPPQPWAGDLVKAPHKERLAMGQQAGAAARYDEWAATPEASDERRHYAEQERMRAKRQAESDADQARWEKVREAERKQRAAAEEAEAEERRKDWARAHPMKARVYEPWSDDATVGEKRQRLVAWLMMKPRYKSLSEARLIASRKYR